MESIVRQLPGITKGVTFTRFVRKDVIKVYDDGSQFEIGKGVVLHESDNDAATIISSGILLDEALLAYEALKAEGINVRVVDMFTWKPLDDELVVKCAKETGAIVTAEEHSVIGGLGSAVAEVVTEECPVPVIKVGVQDTFGMSGPANDLLGIFGLRAKDIVEKAKQAIAAKK
jgi:transketolase